MPQTPNIDHAVQRCRELAEEAGRITGPIILDDAVRIGVSAVHAKDALTLVLAELERLREAEGDEGLEARFADTNS